MDSREIKQIGNLYYFKRRPFTGIIVHRSNALELENIVSAINEVKNAVPDGTEKAFDEHGHAIGVGKFDPINNIQGLRVSLPNIVRVAVEWMEWGMVKKILESW